MSFKVALVRLHFSLYGGGERYLSRFARALLERGVEVHLFSRSWNGGEQEGIHVHRVPALTHPRTLRVLSFAAFSALALRRQSFDVVHSFERTLRQDIYRAGDGCHREWLLQRGRSVPSWDRALTSLHPFHRSILAVERAIFEGEGTRRVLTNSRRGREEILRHYRAAPEKVQVLYNGVDLDRFHPGTREELGAPLRRDLGIPPDSLLLLFVGSGFERKGLRAAISAVAALKKRGAGGDLLLAVVGKGKTAPYRRLAEDLGIAERVLFLGPRANLEAFYGASDLFVLPTLYEPFSNACLEAMASGVPVVTSRINGAAELLEEGKGGAIVAEPTDTEEIAAALADLLPRERRSEAGRQAREVALHFSLESSVENTLRVYREIAPGRGEGNA